MLAQTQNNVQRVTLTPLRWLVQPRVVVTLRRTRGSGSQRRARGPGNLCARRVETMCYLVGAGGGVGEGRVRPSPGLYPLLCRSL